LARYRFTTSPATGLAAFTSYRIDTSSGGTSAATIESAVTAGQTVGPTLRTDDTGTLPPFAGTTGTLYAKQLTPGGVVTGSPVTLTGTLTEATAGSNSPEALSATYAPIPVPRLYSPRGLRRWRRALADAITTPAVVTCYGTSITYGQNADNSSGGATSAVQANYRTRGYPAQLRALFAATYGSNPGEGAVLIDAANDARIVETGIGTEVTSGPAQKGRTLDAGTDKVAISIPANTAEVRIVTWNPSTGIVALGYNWDGSAAPGTAVTTGSADTFSTTVITPPDSSAHTLNIWGPASGTGYLSRVDIFDVATASRRGVIVNRVGLPGMHTGTAFGQTGANQRRIQRATFDATATNLAIFEFGANDYWYQPGGHAPGNSPTPTEFGVNLQVGIDCVTNQNGKTTMSTPGCVLLLAGSRRPTWDLGGSPTYDEESYYAVMKALAASNDHVAFLDFREAWGDNATAAASGMNAASDVHPYRAGHGDMARIIHRAITSPEIPVS
jgi:GDSL-like Lipase/Acylhydrolase family